MGNESLSPISGSEIERTERPFTVALAMAIGARCIGISVLPSLLAARRPCEATAGAQTGLFLVKRDPGRLAIRGEGFIGFVCL